MPIERSVSLPKRTDERPGQAPIYTAGRASIGVAAGEMPVNVRRRGEPRILAFAQEPEKNKASEKIFPSEKGRIHFLQMAVALFKGSIASFGSTPEREESLRKYQQELEEREAKQKQKDQQ